MRRAIEAAREVVAWRAAWVLRFCAMPQARQNTIFWCAALALAVIASMAFPDPAYAQNLESFAGKVRGLLSSSGLQR